jgi:molybdopterin/thiamine biosynthesis adenylyltransferase
MADRMTIRAAVVMAMAVTLIQEMILIALLDFFETRYRLAMYSEKSRIYFFRSASIFSA